MQNNFESREKRQRYNCKAGDVFGRLTLTGMSYLQPMYNQRRRIVEAKCECGVVKEYVLKRLLNGETQSCGCLRVDVAKETMTTHGLTLHPLYDVRLKMIERCYNTEDKSYKDYGARGIEVWKDWFDDFLPFYEWAMAHGWKKGLDLDRIDNDGNYAPHNCRFVTKAVGNRNRRNNVMITAFGETKCLWDWGSDRRCKIGVWGLRNRLDRGKWTNMEEMITAPPTKRKDIQRNMKSNKMLTAFGITKCMSAWLEDSRCKVKIDSLRDRLDKGWTAHRAIATPPTQSGKKGVKRINLKEEIQESRNVWEAFREGRNSPDKDG